jgi:rare lipoprotein A
VALLASLATVPSHVRRAAPEPPAVFVDVARASAPPTTPAPPSRAVKVARELRRGSRAIVGYATYYGRMFEGRLTASGVRFDPQAMVAAHPTYPFGTLLRVTNLRNGSSTRVRVVDRGPALGPRRRGVIIDVSRAAAQSLGMVRAGRARVRLEVLPAE